MKDEKISHKVSVLGYFTNTLGKVFLSRQARLLACANSRLGSADKSLKLCCFERAPQY